ncbi:MAG: ABC transporter ATP-binding protein/permease [Verrucomicrobiae bacterium]|nr:ABC transporter ATP-binding protein/permease [Verrucomicrobiae bacterium]
MEKNDTREISQNRLKRFLQHSAKDFLEIWPYFKRLGKYVKPYRFRWIAGLALGGIAGSWEGALLPFLKWSLESLEKSKVQLSLWEIVLAGSLVPFYFIVRAVLGYLSVYCTMWVGLRILFDLKTEIFSALQRLSLDYFANQKSGKLIFQVVQRTKNTQMVLTQLVSDVIKQPMALIGVIAYMIHHNPKFTFMVLFFIPASLIPALIIGYRVRRKGRAEESSGAETVTILQENLLGMRVVKSYAQSADEIRRFKKAGLDEYNASMRNRKLLELVGPSVEVLASIGFGAAIIYGIYTHMAAKDLIIVATGIFLMYGPFKSLSRIYVTAQRVSTMLQGLFSILDTKPSVENVSNALVIDSSQGRVELENIKFKYVVRRFNEEGGPQEGRILEQRRALKNVSLVFEPGKFYALVGPSGAGKSSIFNLIMRFYEPQQGRVLIDGKDIRDIEMESLRRQIGLVSQETFLFHASIRENILYGRPKASQESIERAAALAHADEFIEQLPKKYDTIVGDKGCRFSGGQQQRLSLARAFLKNAPILLLDEATSALDAESAAKVQDAIDKFSAGRTVIAIAHRLSTIERADEIIVLDKGQVVARGTHEFLLNESALYRRLNELQFGGNALIAESA